MKNDFQDEAEVLIWNQGFSIGRMPVPGVAPGHAALELRSLRPEKAHNRCFISWWPGGDTSNPFKDQPAHRHMNRQEAKEAEMGETAHGLLDAYADMTAAMNDNAQPRPGQKPLRGMAGWGQSAHEKVRLPLVGTVRASAGHAPAPFGLVGTPIRLWFQQRLANNRIYCFASATHNCSGTVNLAMMAGGGEAFAPAPRNMMISPFITRDWAQAMLASINTRNEWFNRVYGVVHTMKVMSKWLGNAIAHELPNGELLGPENFADKTIANMSNDVRGIRTALEAYHAAGPWEAPTARMRAIVALFDLIAPYVEQRNAARAAHAEFQFVLLLLHQIKVRLDALGTPPYPN